MKDNAGNISHLKCLFAGRMPEIDGEETLAQAKDVFAAGIYGAVKRSACKATPKIKMVVYEMIKDGTLAQIFGGIGDDLNNLCLTQPQIIQFVVKHRNRLRTDGYGTLFLFKVSDEFFVAFVYFGDYGRLRVHADRFSSDGVWNAERRHRIVVPQLTLRS